MTEDTAAAATFYSKLLGWHAHAHGGDPAYTELHARRSCACAGMMKMPDSAKAMGAKPPWMPYIGADEVDRRGDRDRAPGRQSDQTRAATFRTSADLPS